MTRPGFSRRPSLPCADSVALMSAFADVCISQFKADVAASLERMAGSRTNGAGLELAATRLTIMRAARLGHYPTTEDMDVVNDRDGEWGWAHVNNADPLPFKVQAIAYKGRKPLSFGRRVF